MVSVRTMLPRDLLIFDSSKRSQPWAVMAFGRSMPAAMREGGPVDAVEADDLFAY